MQDQTKKKIEKVKKLSKQVGRLISEIIQTELTEHEKLWYKQLCIIKSNIDTFIRTQEKK